MDRDPTPEQLITFREMLKALTNGTATVEQQQAAARVIRGALGLDAD